MVKTRYKFPLGNLMSNSLKKKYILTFRYKLFSVINYNMKGDLRTQIKWADGKLVKTELDAQVFY